MQASSKMYFVGYTGPERTGLAVIQLDLSSMHERSDYRPASGADFLDAEGAIEHAKDLSQKFGLRLERSALSGESAINTATGQ